MSDEAWYCVFAICVICALVAGPVLDSFATKLCIANAATVEIAQECNK